MHLDIRADNVVLDEDNVTFVDWPWAGRGARWIDLVAFLPSVAMQGGPDPEDVWHAHPWSAGVDPEAVDGVLAAFAGMFTRQALRPAPPGLPTLRQFQAAQGTTARDWLAQRRHWLDARGTSVDHRPPGRPGTRSGGTDRLTSGRGRAMSNRVRRPGAA